MTRRNMTNQMSYYAEDIAAAQLRVPALHEAAMANPDALCQQLYVYEVGGMEYRQTVEAVTIDGTLIGLAWSGGDCDLTNVAWGRIDPDATEQIWTRDDGILTLQLDDRHEAILDYLNQQRGSAMAWKLRGTGRKRAASAAR